MHFDEKQRTSDTIIGYVAYFKLLNGFEKYLYMTEEQVTAHGKKYSASYNNKNSMWQKDAGPMKLKTVLKMLISKFGILSIEMQSAVVYDQATVKTMDGAYEYIDNPGDGNVIDAESFEADPAVMIIAFDQSIPKTADAAILEDFLTRTAASNKSTVEAVKIEGAKDPAAFWKIFSAYEKQQNVKKAKETLKSAEVEEGAPGECPEQPGTTFLKSYCDKCEHRIGCPVWK